MSRLLASLVLLVAVGVGAAAAGGASWPALGPHGIGPVRLGTPKPAAVAELGRLFGRPTARGANTGCGPRYTEVEWGDLVAEFRGDAFSGFRYRVGGWPLTTPGSPRETPPTSTEPKLATANGVSLGTTLVGLRRAYGALRLVGTDRWQSPNGLVFVDDATRSAVPPRSRHVVEIKVRTCGDF